nr:LuxR family transcriptional regulator [Kribbella shirazensis]
MGRREERSVLDDLLVGARAGRSAALVIRGGAGIGKTALLSYLLERSTGCRVLRAAGVQSEMELSYAGLHQLCTPLLTGLDHLPAPQRDALATAFGLHSGDVPSRFLVCLAALGLLAQAGDSQPLVCLVDDAQWLDQASAQTFEFVARRLHAESVVLVFAVREPDSGPALAGLPELHLTGLSEPESRVLLESVVGGRLDRRVRDRIIAEAHGNPLALLELPHGLTAAEMAAGFMRSDASALPSRLEQGFLRRFQSLSTETRLLLVTAAAEPTGDIGLLRRAATQLGVAVDAASDDAEASGLLTLGGRVSFRHPLVRSAAYHAADQEDRRTVHQALADATDPERDPDRRAWHLALATAGPDEAVSAELERTADRALARGGLAAAAAFLERAAELTPDAAGRGPRVLAAANAKYQAGAFDAALGLAGIAELSPLDDLSTAQLTLLRGRILALTRGVTAALPLLLDAAGRLEQLDPALAHETYRDAVITALSAGGLPRHVAEAILAAPKPSTPTHEVLLLDGLSRVVTDGYQVGAERLIQTLTAFRTEGVPRDAGLGWLQLACRLATDVWDFDSWSVLTAMLVDAGRDAGALSVLAPGLLLRLCNRVRVGDLAGADSLAVEVAAVGEATRSSFWPHYGALFLEPWRGREAPTLGAIEAITRALRSVRGHAKVMADTQWAAAVLYNGLGRYEEAFAAAQRGSENPEELGLSIYALVELVEAAARLGRPSDAAEAVQVISNMARATGTDWALGHAANARALVSEGRVADELYLEAIGRLDATEIQMDLARFRLCYGEWLRRENRRADARAQLGLAYEMLGQFGAESFAERAHRELQATGATVRKRVVSTHAELTAQEAQIARLAAEGLTNSEIGARLFISPHTVDWHLRKVFSKLGIASRRQIRTMLGGAATSA